MNPLNKIVILICYYGEFPWYFQYFIHSCCYNPTVDFVIITDNEVSQDLPANVKFVNIPWKEISTVIGRQLDLDVHVDTPYKLCDFKPAYGYLFPGMIKDYDFWGHGDIDIIFGNIRNFLTNEVLENNDLVCVRHDVLTGYFLLFRNCKKMNELFRRSRDYKKVFTSPKHYCFDETNFAFEAFKSGLPVDKIQTEVESMNHVVNKLREHGEIRAYFNFHVIEGNPGRLCWEKGTLTYKNRFEAILYHMVRFKNKCQPIRMRNIPDRFYISPTRIYR